VTRYTFGYHIIWPYLPTIKRAHTVVGAVLQTPNQIVYIPGHTK